MTCVVAIDAGTTGVRSFAVGVRRPAAAWRTASSRSTSRSRVGSSTTPTTSGASRSRRSAEVAAQLGGRGRDHRRDRHHQPARDGRGVGPPDRTAAPPRDRLAGPAHGRRAATRCATRAHEPLIRRAHRPRARPVLLGVEARVAAARRRGRRRRRSRVRHRRHVDPLEPHGRPRRRRARDRPVEREPHDALRHRRARLVGGAAPRSSTCPTACLPAVSPSSGRFGVTRADRAAGLVVPVSGIAGDQQAALFGQACVEPGMTKNTYGTGSFVLTNVGPPPPRSGRRAADHDRVVARNRAPASPTRWRARSS